jgi:hypothetical protein
VREAEHHEHELIRGSELVRSASVKAVVNSGPAGLSSALVRHPATSPSGWVRVRVMMTPSSREWFIHTMSALEVFQ